MCAALTWGFFPGRRVIRPRTPCPGPFACVVRGAWADGGRGRERARARRHRSVRLRVRVRRLLAWISPQVRCSPRSRRRWASVGVRGRAGGASRRGPWTVIASGGGCAPRSVPEGLGVLAGLPLGVGGRGGGGALGGGRGVRRGLGGLQFGGGGVQHLVGEGVFAFLAGELGEGFGRLAGGGGALGGLEGVGLGGEFGQGGARGVGGAARDRSGRGRLGTSRAGPWRTLGAGAPTARQVKAVAGVGCTSRWARAAKESPCQEIDIAPRAASFACRSLVGVAQSLCGVMVAFGAHIWSRLIARSVGARMTEFVRRQETSTHLEGMRIADDDK